MKTLLCRSLFMLAISALSLIVLLSVKPLSEQYTVLAASPQGMEGCITTSGDNVNDTIFTNSCNQDLDLIVAGPRNTWAPGLLHPGGRMTHDNGNGPFRWFACNAPYTPYDSQNQSNWPNYNTAEYVCK